MKILFSFILVAMAACAVKQKPENLKTPGNASFYDLKALSLEGDTIDFSRFKGKKVLIVNTASRCGFTPQYEELQKLHEQYQDKLVVLGFPCNQFGDQEPGSSGDIKEFCRKNYGVTFQMFEKVDVKGGGKHPVYQWLTDKKKNGWNSKEPGWNFCKYLVNEDGELENYFASAISPVGPEVRKALVEE